jgi:hypothetical protein
LAQALCVLHCHGTSVDRTIAPCGGNIVGHWSMQCPDAALAKWSAHWHYPRVGRGCIERLERWARRGWRPASSYETDPLDAAAFLAAILDDVLPPLVRFTPLEPHRLVADDATEQRQQWVVIVIHPPPLPPESRESDHQRSRGTGEPDNIGHVALFVGRHHHILSERQRSCPTVGSTPGSRVLIVRAFV